MDAKYFLAAALFAAPLPAAAGSITQTNLVSDGWTQAPVIDPNLKNPWGISYSPGGPFWVSDNATGLTTVYNSSGAIQSLVVTIPQAAGGTGPGSPTGQVFNPSSDFVVSAGGASAAAAFIFATEDGTISGWSFSVNPAAAVIAVDRSSKGAVYKGLAFYTDSKGKNYLLATDFHAGRVNVFDSTFKRVASFRDTTLPAHLSPYNVAVLNGNIFVTYAVPDAGRHDSVSGKGKGAIEEVTFSGQVLARYVHGVLNAPWGLAVAPASFAGHAGDILVGNFGDGEIDAFTSALAPHGVLKDSTGAPIAIDGLWGLIAGNGGSGGAADTIYFTAGTNNEADGLFGALTYTP
jgi:uncharacterized protein (TIGR03118 family)